MKFLLVILCLCSLQAFAQNDSDGEGKSEMRFLGRTWSPTFYSLASLDGERSTERGGRLSTYNYFSFHSFLTGPYRFSLRLPFTYGSAGTDDFNGEKNNKQELLLQDPILEVRNPTFTYLPWDMQLFWAGRIYLPVSKNSKASGQIARFRNHVAVGKVFNRYLGFEAQNRYYYSWQSRTAYPTTFTDEYGFEVVDATASTKEHEIENWLTVFFRTTPSSWIGATVQTEDSFYHKSPANNNKYKEPQRFISVGPSASVPLNDSVKFIASYNDKVNREENLAELGQFLTKNTEFVLHSFVNF